MTFVNNQTTEFDRLSWPMSTPDHWKIDRLKWSIAGLFAGTWGDEPTGVNDIICVRVADFNRTHSTVVEAPPTLRSVDARELTNRLLRPGDLLIEKSGGGDNQPVGCVVQFDHNFPAVCSNFVGRMPPASGMWPRYWTYVHASLYSGRLNLPAIKQTTGIQNLDTDAYFNQRVPFPPLRDQRAIADYLDRETAQIDALVAAKERVLDLLAEKRRALITRAVTRGLDPNTALRDPRIPWLEEIPAHWRSVRLRFLIRHLEQGWSPEAENREPIENEWGVLKLNAVSRGRFDPAASKALPSDFPVRADMEVRQGDFLITRANTPFFVGDACYVSQTRPRLMLCDLIYRLTLIAERIDGRFLGYFLTLPEGRCQIEADARGTSNSMVKISQEHIKNWRVPVPPLDEQRAIIDHLERETAKLDVMGSATERTIALLKERRAALIAAAVTGMLDISDGNRHRLAGGQT